MDHRTSSTSSSSSSSSTSSTSSTDQPGRAQRLVTGPLLVVLAAAAWGTGGLVGSVLGATTGLSPVAVGTYRLLVAACVLLAVAGARGQLGGLARTVVTAVAARGDAVRLVGVGVGLAVFQACYFLAVAQVGVSIATMLTLGSAPVLVTVGAAALLRERPDRRLAVALPLALLGLLLLVDVPAGGEGGSAAAGVAFSLTSATGYAMVTLLGRSLGTRLPAERTTVVGFVVAALVSLPVGLWSGLAFELDVLPVALVVYLGVVPTALAYTLFFAGLRTTQSGAASVLTLVEPLTATVLAVLLLSERLAALQWVGAGLLCVTVVVLSRERRRAPADGRTATPSVSPAGAAPATRAHGPRLPR